MPFYIEYDDVKLKMLWKNNKHIINLKLGKLE